MKFLAHLKSLPTQVWTAIKSRPLLGGVISLLIAAVAGAVISGWYDDFRESQRGHPFVAVILSDDDPNFTIPEELAEGIESAMARDPLILTGNGPVEIRISQTESPDHVAETVHSRCLDHRDCIAIVGNSDSTTTKAMLEEILAFQGIRPALIMPIATATSLTERAAIANYSQILRLVPSNTNQATRIKSFIASYLGRGVAQRVTVIVDPNNEEYSQNLSRIIVQMIDDNDGDAKIIRYSDASTLNEEVLANQNFIVFVGTSTTGLDIIKDMKRLGITIPIIFTDGNTVQEVIDRSMEMPGPAFFLTPVAELSDSREPGYTAIGRDTYALLSTILQRSPMLTRRGVADFVSENKYNIALETGAAGAYHFGADGENSAMLFQIFRVDEHGVVHIERGY